MEWWTGGFTARAPFIKAIEETGAKPWDLVREHQYAPVDPRPHLSLTLTLALTLALTLTLTSPPPRP